MDPCAPPPTRRKLSCSPTPLSLSICALQKSTRHSCFLRQHLLPAPAVLRLPCTHELHLQWLSTLVLQRCLFCFPRDASRMIVTTLTKLFSVLLCYQSKVW
uniref:Uncharacterized protein n=1 Tax=Triticum urartu TaxID=4572 RepID=A0A8R7VI47_TRIUA